MFYDPRGDDEGEAEELEWEEDNAFLPAHFLPAGGLH